MSKSIGGELASETGEWGGEPLSEREWDDETGEDGGEPGVDLDPGSGSGKLLAEPGCDWESCMRR